MAAKSLQPAAVTLVYFTTYENKSVAGTFRQIFAEVCVILHTSWDSNFCIEMSTLCNLIVALDALS